MIRVTFLWMTRLVYPNNIYNLKMNVTAVDTAQENMGIARMRNGVIDMEALTSIHITSDGRLFEYHESQVVPLCWEWVHTYSEFWRGSSLIYLEPAISFHKGNERACLLIHTSLYSIFLTLYQLGMGPKPIVKVAKWWKVHAGIEVGGHANANDRGANHATNKIRSIEHYRKVFGQRDIDELLQKWGKIDDIIDCRWMLHALVQEHDTLIGPNFYSNHVEAPNITRVRAEDRMRPLPPLHQMHPPRFTPHELRRNYNDFVARRRLATQVRKNTRLLKRLKR
jgi:hypothetical protein